MGISYNASDAPNITALLTLPFFDVDGAATLTLVNISMNLDCGTFTALQTKLCGLMPDSNYEVALWSLRVVSLVTPNLLASNVSLRCGLSATDSTVTVTYLASDQGVEGNGPTFASPVGIPCVALRMFNYIDFLRPWVTYPNTQPQAFYLMVMANLTKDNPFARPRTFAPKYRVSITISGRPDVRTLFDLRNLVNIISLLDSGNDPSNPTNIEFRDITLVNLAYGPQTLYPAALVTASLWFLEYRRTNYSIIFSQSPTRVTMTRVTFVVSDSELRWWGGLVRNALSTNATGVDPDALIHSFTPGLQVDQQNGNIWVPYWEWVYGMMSWTNCTLTSTPLMGVPLDTLAARPDLLDTLPAYGQDPPVPLSAIRLARQDLDASLFADTGSNVILPLDTQLSASLAESQTVLGANLTIWGEGRGVRYLDLKGMSGVVTVPPYTVLTLRFVVIVNPGVGPRVADQPLLQNYTMMMWAFRRTLLPASTPARRAALSAAAGADAAAAAAAAASGVDCAVVQGDPGNDVRRRSCASAGRWRRLTLAEPSMGGSSAGSVGSNTSNTDSSSIPIGPFRPWLRLENVDWLLPAVEVQLMYDIITFNRTSLRVSPVVVDWLRGVLRSAKVANYTSARLDFKSISWLGIEAVNISMDGHPPSSTTVKILQQSASILLPDLPSPPPPRPSPGPPPVVSPSPNPSLTPQPKPTNTVSVSPPPPLVPSNPVVFAAVDAAPAAETPIGAIVGPAVGSAAGLLLLCGLVAFIIVFVRHRRKQARQAAAGKGNSPEKAAESMGGADGRVPSSRHASRPADAGNGQPLPPPSPLARAVAGTAAAADEPVRRADAGGDAGLGEIQPATDDDAKHASGLPPRVPNKHRRSRADGGGTRVSSRNSGNGDRAGGGNSGPGSSSRQRKSRSAGSAASAGSGSKSSGIASDTFSTNPRTELYAALAAFQTELGEQQQQITILSQLGAGAHGVVYRGEWRGLEVAVKTLLFQAFVGSNVEDSGNSLKEQAMLEAAIATTLYHPNVINTFSYDIKPLRMCPAPASSTNSSRAETVVSSEGGGIMDWKLYIIQEYCDGGTLKDALDGGRFTDPDTGMALRETAVRVAIEIASGMAYVHGRNIIHGDLKPANILLRSNSASPYGYTAKIADFGLALKLKASESHISNIRRGTPFYIACELVEDGRATTASDLYSFGVILWELLHGSTVARRLPLRRRIPNLPSEFYTWPPDCPPAYRELATACLSSNPSSRPRFTEALATLSKLLNSLIEARRQEQRRRQQQQQEDERRRRLAMEAPKLEQEGRSQAEGQGADSDAHDRDRDRTRAEADGAAGEGGVSANNGAEVVWSPPFLLGAKPATLPGRMNNSGGGTAGGASSSGGLPGGNRRTDSGGGVTSVLPEVDSDGTGPTRRRVETMVASAAAAAMADHGPLGVASIASGLGQIISSGCGKPPLEPMPEDAVLQLSSEPSGNAVLAAANAESRNTKPDAVQAAGLQAAGPAAGTVGSTQPQVYMPFGGARPTTLRALVRTTSAAAAEAQAAAASGAVGGVSREAGAGRPGSDNIALHSPLAARVPPPQPPSLQQQQHVGSQSSHPSGSDPPGGATAVGPGLRSPAVPRLDEALPTTADAASSPAANGGATQPGDPHLGFIAGNGSNDCSNTSALPQAAYLLKPPAALTAAGAGAGAPFRGAAPAHAYVPATTAAVAALGAVAANSVTNTRTLDHSTVGMLDSCLGSTDARAMDRGLMLDLMPALSNQAHSNRVSSALSPELAVALENLLGAHGIRWNVAPGLEPAGLETGVGMEAAGGGEVGRAGGGGLVDLQEGGLSGGEREMGGK